MQRVDHGKEGTAAARFLGALRDGGWISRQRLVVYSWMLIVAGTASFAWTFTGSGIEDSLGRPIGTDFLSFWSVSAALRQGRLAIVYSPAALAAFERSIAGGAPGFYAWFYPPIALFLVAPLALLPYLWSLALWLALGLAVYLVILWRILRSRLGLLAACAFPAVFVTLEHGQNAFVTTSLFGGAMLLIGARPALAGVLIGGLAFKPQLGLLIPLALACGGRWRAFAAAAATVLALGAASLLLFGPEAWHGFFTGLALSRQTLEMGLVPFAKLQSVFAAVRLMGGSIAVAYGVQALATVGAAAVVAWAWRGPAAPELKGAVLVVGSLLATPFLLDYDLLLLALPIAWLARAALADGGRPFERSGLALAGVLPLLARPVGMAADVPLSPFVLAALLALLVARIAAEGG